jgi:hypothetical protein
MQHHHNKLYCHCQQHNINVLNLLNHNQNVIEHQLCETAGTCGFKVQQLIRLKMTWNHCRAGLCLGASGKKYIMGPQTK